MNTRPLIIAVLLLLTILFAAQHHASAREWAVQKIEGKLVAVDRKAKIATIQRADGRRLTLDYAFMTKDDLAYIKKHSKTLGPNMKGIFVELKNRASTSRCRAVLVGVNDYNEFDPLRFCKADMELLRDALPQLGLKKEDIICLTAGSDFRTHPTAKRVKKSILATLAGLDEDDVVVIALSGHGVLLDYSDRPDESFFCPQDASLDDTERTMVSISWLFKQLDKCPARFKMLLVDACRNRVKISPNLLASKGISGIKSVDGFNKSIGVESRLPKGTVMFLSCDSGEYSREDPKLGHGLFTHYFIEGLTGRADTQHRGNRDGIVSIKELREYVRFYTGEHAWRAGHYRQTPSLYTSWGRELPDFPLAQAIGQPVDFTNSIGMKFKLISASEFMMGSPEDEKARYDDEGPVHRVRITKPYYLGVHEVTQGEYEKMMGTSPWKGKKYAKEGSDYAANYISWEDAVEFCKKLSKKEGRTYRLPTEAQWEYACRAGSQTAYSFGNDSANLSSYAWWDDNADFVGKDYAHRVGQKPPNAWGLHDMHGNVWEWCSDRYDKEYYAKSPVDDPTGPTGSGRVHRGGCWDSHGGSCRSASRRRSAPGSRYSFLGIRLALVPSE